MRCAKGGYAARIAMPEIVTLSCGKFWLDESGILRGVAHDGVENTLEQAREQIALQRTMGGGRPRPLLMDIRAVRSLSREARAYYASPVAAEVISATALLIASPLSRALGNFFLGLNKPHMPTRLFTDEAEAMAWLREHL